MRFLTKHFLFHLILFEKLVFEAVTKHEPGVKQKVVVKDSGYSKAKVSKVLKNLQERGLLRLERIGRTNKIYYDKKFKKKNFVELLMDIQNVPMKAQKVLLENNLDNWKGDLDQMDDIMVIGVQL